MHFEVYFRKRFILCSAFCGIFQKKGPFIGIFCQIAPLAGSKACSGVHKGGPRGAPPAGGGLSGSLVPDLRCAEILEQSAKIVEAYSLRLQADLPQ